jgi:hypothetical protein
MPRRALGERAGLVDRRAGQARLARHERQQRALRRRRPRKVAKALCLILKARRVVGVEHQRRQPRGLELQRELAIVRAHPLGPALEQRDQLALNVAPRPRRPRPLRQRAGLQRVVVGELGRAP